MYIIKWSNGDTYSQSFKKDKHAVAEHAAAEHAVAEHAAPEHAVAEHAVAEHVVAEHVAEHVVNDYSGVSRQYVFKDSYKEEVSHRVGEREHIQQCCVNPFLGMNFVKDLAVQEEYLKPKNSNYSKK